MKPKTIAIALSVALLAGLASLDAVAGKGGAGEVVVSSTGVRPRLQRPLDFLVVADHAENLGLAPMIAEKNPDLLKLAFGKRIAQLVYDGKYGDA